MVEWSSDQWSSERDGELKTDSGMKSEREKRVKNFSKASGAARFARRFLTLLVVAACSLDHSTTRSLAYAAPSPGVTAVPILQIPIGSRAAGIAGAFTGVADDAFAMYYNPAGLSLLNSQESAAQFIKGLADTAMEFAGYVHPLSFPGISERGHASVAASVLFSQNGKIEINRTNADGSLRDSRTVSAGSDLVASLGYAEKMGDVDLFGTRFALHGGFAGKYIQTSLVQTYNASAAALDAGLLLSSRQKGLRFGASVLNMGNTVRFIEKADPLPLMLKAGASYLHQIGRGQNLRLVLQGDYFHYEKQTEVAGGFEYSYGYEREATVAIRAGYRGLNDVAGLSFGFGIQYEMIQMDYAWSLSRDLSDMHLVTLTYRIGAIPETKRGYRLEYRLKSPSRSLEEPTLRKPPRRTKPQAPEKKGKTSPLVPGWD